MAVTITDMLPKAGWSDGGRTYEAKVQVISDATIGGKAAIDACNLFAGLTYRWPLTVTATETDPATFLKNVTAEPKDLDGLVWEVSLSFGFGDPAQDPRGPIDEDGNRDPFAAPPVLRSFAEAEEIALVRDRDGTEILNSAGDPFDPPLTLAIPVLTFEVSRFEREFDPALIVALQGTINDDVWLDWPAGSVLCRTITSTRAWNQDVNGFGWDVTYTLAVKQPLTVSSKLVYPGWDLQVLDAGYREKGTARNKAILDEEGLPVSVPWPLKSDGTKALAADAPHYKVFQVYPTADFTLLDFPSDLFTAGTP